jgi:hypothetical protein
MSKAVEEEIAEVEFWKWYLCVWKHKSARIQTNKMDFMCSIPRIKASFKKTRNDHLNLAYFSSVRVGRESIVGTASRY